MADPWRLVEAEADRVSELSRALKLPEAVARVLVIRGFSDPLATEKFLRKSLTDLVGPFELPGMESGANRVVKAVIHGEKILIHGDFDADGITSASMLALFFRDIGVNVFPFVPNRLVEGHGISSRAIEIAAREGIKLVITCDCGSSSAKEISELARLGIDTVVTDHHALPATLPVEAILVNPQHEDTHTALDDLSGVGVAFMLAAAVRSKLRDEGFFSERAEPNMREYLDVVALGTLADMAPLVGQNRILVAWGLEQLGRSSRPGIVSMRTSAGLQDQSQLGTEDVGFRLAPRINAAARLGHSEEALELLITSDFQRARELSGLLERYNEDRKSRLETMMRLAWSEAQSQIEEGRRSIVVASSDFHPGIIGLVAQKLAVELQLPVFVFAKEGELARGSARSRTGVDLVGILNQIQDILLGFGGHREACGCTIELRQLPNFKKRFEDAVLQAGIYAAREVKIDAVLSLGQLNREVVEWLAKLRPFGIGNPEPVFSAKVRVDGVAKEMGRDHLQATLVDESGARCRAVGFGMWRSSGDLFRGELEVAYTPEESEWKGRRGLQLRLKGSRSV